MDFTPILIWIFCVGVGAILVSFLLKQIESGDLNLDLAKKEGFVNQRVIYSVRACPVGSTTYITSKGDTQCCSTSDIVNKQCTSTIVCSLSPNPPTGVDTCSEWLTKEWTKRSTRFCPSTIPNYFGPLTPSASHSKEGCASGPITSDGSAPQQVGGTQCKIYEKSEDEYGRRDSCLNLKAIEMVKCPTVTAEKSILESEKGLPALLTCSFVPPNNSSPVPVVCYEAERAKLYMKTKLGGSWEAKLKEKGLALNSMLSLCGTSKNYYIDGSVAAKDVRF